MTTAESNQKKIAKANAMHEEFLNSRFTLRITWAKIGVMAREFAKEELYKLRGFSSMKAYLKSLPDVCYSTVAEAQSIAEVFPEWDEEELAQYPKENLKIIRNLPERQRSSKAILEACRDLKAKDLRAKLNKKHNTNLEGKTRVIFDVEDSVADHIIEPAIEDAMKRINKKKDVHDDAATRAEAVEMIFLMYCRKVGLAG